MELKINYLPCCPRFGFVTVFFAFSTVLITVTGEENLGFYTALFCPLVIYFDIRAKIIEARRKAKKKSRGFLLLGLYLTVICERKDS